MTKYIFFDIDGTIWDEYMNIPQSTKETIVKLKENGHKTFLCSGRSRSNIRSRELLDLGFDGIIAACGNYIEMDGKVLYDNLLPQDFIRKAIALLEEEHMPVVLEGPVNHWVDADTFVDDPYVDYLIQEMGRHALPIKGYEGNFEIEKFSADITSQTNFDRVKEELAPVMNCLVHEGNVVEFVPTGTSKATGIQKLMDLMNIQKDDLYAIGDSVNDLDMLQFVPHSIAMGNATQIAKDSAEFITTDIHSDGIKNAMSHYGLI